MRPDETVYRHLGSIDHLRSLDFISGHIGYDVLLNSDLDLDEYLLVTILRHPFTQTLSHMNWVIRISADTESLLFKHAKPHIQKLSLDLRAVPEWSAEVVMQWLERHPGWFQNNQSRYFTPPDRLSDQAVIEVLSRMGLVGVTERIDRFVARFRKIAKLPYRFRVPPVPHDNQNETYQVPTSVLADPKLQAFLRAYNSVDMAVYRHVERLMAP